MPNITAWTERDVERLKKLVDLKMSNTRIASEMGRTTGQISGKIGRLGLRGDRAMPLHRKEMSPRARKAPPRVPAPRFKVDPPPVILPDHELDRPRVPIETLENHHCRAPSMGPDGRWWFCGLAKVPQKSYCFGHLRRFEQPPKPDKDSAPEDQAPPVPALEQA